MPANACLRRAYAGERELYGGDLWRRLRYGQTDGDAVGSRQDELRLRILHDVEGDGKARAPEYMAQDAVLDGVVSGPGAVRPRTLSAAYERGMIRLRLAAPNAQDGRRRRVDSGAQRRFQPHCRPDLVDRRVVKALGV
jgi:hypothetical protein